MIQAIIERDKTIQESSKRFSQLRDDFKYNLSLLEARDQEIKRLEGLSAALSNDYQVIKAEKIALTQRVDKLLTKEANRKEKSRNDISSQKVNHSFIKYPIT